MLPLSCIDLLSLPPEALSLAERRLAQAELMEAAALAGPTALWPRPPYPGKKSL
jgi:hypothetical protein